MTETHRQLTCEERVDAHLESRLDDLRMMLAPEHDDVELLDDGSLDTVLRIDNEEFRYSDTSDCRDEDGALDLDAFLEDHFDDMAETMYERFHEYGLGFDYVEPGTFNDQSEGYFRYQISWGGPSDEFRFFCNPDLTVHRVEYWFLDWFDGASRTVTSDPTVQRLVEWFSEVGAFQSALSS